MLVAVLFVAAFNGQWRIGRDSAAYRGLGRQLAATGEYTFRDRAGAALYSDQQDIRYPGMPLMLAAIEKVFGRRDWPAVLAVTLMALATLVLTYRLMRPVVPGWLAIAVVFGMGANGRFLEHSNEILSDVPFLLGVVVSLLAFDRLSRSRDARSRAQLLAMLVGGLILAAAMRPTFWVLAVALVATCVWGLLRPTHAGELRDDGVARRSRRMACLLTLGVLAITAITFALVVDVRGKQGGYERKVGARLQDFTRKIVDPLPGNVYALLEQTLPESFFGTQLGPGFIPVGARYSVGMSTVFSLIVMGSAVWLVRRNVLWGLFALVTLITMASLGSVPRYFIMILPLLLAGWGLFIRWLGDRFKLFGAREVIAFAGLGMVVIPNGISCLNLIREQRGITRPQEGFRHVGFARAYHGEKWLGIDDVARMIHDHVRPDQRVLGPEATVLTFLSDRDVFGLGMLLPRKDVRGEWDRVIRKQQRGGLVYAVFPDTNDKLYDDKDVVTGRLIRTGMLRQAKVIARAGGYVLAEFQVVTTPKGQRHQRDLAAATQPKVKPVRSAAARRRAAAATQASTQASTQATASTTQPAGRRRGRRPRGAVTPPATMPKTGPATRPAAPAAGGRLGSLGAIFWPAIMGALPAPTSPSPSTMPSTQPVPRNAVRPTPPPFMIGVNLCGAEFGERDLPGVYGQHYTYPTGRELDYYKSKGVMLVRLPFRWERLQRTLNGSLDEAELGRLDQFIGEVAIRDMKVLPEPHNYARYGGQLIGTPAVPNAAFADFWRRLAGHLKGEAAVYAYGLVNEPHDTNGLWPAAAQAAVDAIRSVDRTHYVFVPGDGYSGAADWAKRNPDLWVNDPANRLVYEAHLYFDRDKSGRYVKSYELEKGSPTVGVERLKPFHDWLERRNAIGFIGEFGIPANAGDDVRWQETLRVFVRELKRLEMPGCYWAGGPWWANYPLSIEPRGGVDRAQMTVLREALLGREH